MDGDTIGLSLRRDYPDGTHVESTYDPNTSFVTSQKDARGNSTSYAYDSNGNLTTVTATYDPPRRTFSQDAFGNVPSGSTDGFHLTTKRHYSAIGLYYFYQRWYDPQMGRFTQKDYYPAINRYVYSWNNPINMVDINGRKEEPIKTPTPTPEPYLPTLPDDDITDPTATVIPPDPTPTPIKIPPPWWPTPVPPDSTPLPPPTPTPDQGQIRSPESPDEWLMPPWRIKELIECLMSDCEKK